MVRITDGADTGETNFAPETTEVGTEHCVPAVTHEEEWSCVTPSGTDTTHVPSESSHATWGGVSTMRDTWTR